MGRIPLMIGVVSGVVLLGSVLFMLAEGVAFGDALYFALTTITTVGYGDIVPVTRGGRLVAAFLMLGGVGSALFIITALTSYVMEGRVDFVVVESDSQRVVEAREKGCAVVEGDAANEDVLRQAGLYRCAGVASTISDDAENIYIGLTARSLRALVEAPAGAAHAADQERT